VDTIVVGQPADFKVGRPAAYAHHASALEGGVRLSDPRLLRRRTDPVPARGAPTRCRRLI